jgi:hypothetical protein
MRFNQTQGTFRFSNNTSVYRKACFGAERDGDKPKQRGRRRAMNQNQGDATALTARRAGVAFFMLSVRTKFQTSVMMEVATTIVSSLQHPTLD